MKWFRRKKKLINKQIQGTIILRLTTYIVAYNLAILALIVVSYAFQASAAVITDTVVPNRGFSLRSQLITVGGCMLFMLPFMVYDLLKFSNRVAGPLYRYQQILADFVKSGAIVKAKTRDQDLLTDFEKQFNEFVEAVNTLYPETIAVPSASDRVSSSNKSAQIRTAVSGN